MPEARFTRPRPGSRALPPPQAPVPAAVEPLTTGVVPGGPGGGLDTGILREHGILRDEGPGPYTTELMMDGLDDESKAMLRGRAEPRPAPREPARPTYEPRPVPESNADPISHRLPEVAMPPPDTARARPLTAKPRASAWRPPPAPKPDRPPGLASEPTDPRERSETDRGAPAPARSLDELLTLADEPPEREDTISSATIDLGDAMAPVDELPPARAVQNAPVASPPPRPPMQRALSEEPTLTSSLERLEDEGVAMPGDVVAPGPESATRVARAGAAGDPTVLQRAVADDPLATRPIPRLPETQPDPEAKTRVSRSTPGPSVDSAQLRRETYKPDAPKPKEEPKPEKAEKAEKKRDKEDKGDKPAKGADKEYREPILAWLASIIGLVLIGGGVVILFAFVLLILS